MNKKLSEVINPNHYRVITYEAQKNGISEVITKRYLPDIYALAKLRADYGANEPSIFDTNNDGGFNTLDLLRWLPAWGIHFDEKLYGVNGYFERLELDDFTFGEGVQFLTPIGIVEDNLINFAIVHKKFFGDDLGEPNDSWDLAHFTLEILWKDEQRTVHTYLKR